jgi:hypothetical protein
MARAPTARPWPTWCRPSEPSAAFPRPGRRPN